MWMQILINVGGIQFDSIVNTCKGEREAHLKQRERKRREAEGVENVGEK
jgi:hypothetical protein